MSKIIKLLASPLMMASLVIALAVACAFATFIENDYGTTVARLLIYEAWWFEVIFGLLAINFIAMIFDRKLYQTKKFMVMLFHLGFVIIVLGAAITRYIGKEGTMHIREGETATGFTSSENWIEVHVDNQLAIEKRATFTTASKNKFSRTVPHGEVDIKIQLKAFLPSQLINKQFPINSGQDLLVFDVRVGDKQQELFVPASLANDNPTIDTIAGVHVGIKYGPRWVELPFNIKLNDFILERYPGSESPSSFISDVLVVDNEYETQIPFSIFMNNILNYRGYRFYQSSYDPDEMGTRLSVNNDPWGTGITYFGYFILTLGIIGSLIAPSSRFRSLLSAKSISFLFLLFVYNSSEVKAQDIPQIDVKHARKFGHLLVQDQGGRMKPLSTLSGEVLRKLSRSNKYLGQTPEQVFLGMSAFPDKWQHVPVIHIKNKELRKLLEVEGSFAAFSHFIDYNKGGTYKLGMLIQESFSKKPAQRTAFDKEVIKANEKLNILYMVLSGNSARFFPVPNHPSNKWLSMAEIVEFEEGEEVSIIKTAAEDYSHYVTEVRIATKEGNWDKASESLKKLVVFQERYGSHIVPSKSKVHAEVIANRLLVFERLIPIYGLAGFALLIFVFLELLTHRKTNKHIFNTLQVIVAVGFLLHTLAIALRWYIAGRAPLSNAYESMIYVAWAAMLAGFLFARRNRVVLPTTALVSTITLFVAHLSWMDPEISNLVPVLKSYWLTIHVAVITSSYGFFGMAALLGLINLTLLSIKNLESSESINSQVVSITRVSELSVTLGLYLLTIGSFLGAIWANESWGRYWGWDPKETWALITILVYTLLLHLRLIPGIKTNFTFNFGALIGLGSVLMTYFGVNYYLSGLHSYAGGDPVPIPSWLYFVVAAIFSLAFFAWYNDRAVEVQSSSVQKNS